MPPLALGSDPRKDPLFPAPVPEPFIALPGPFPRPMPVPPSAPPNPSLSPPEGDIASAPVLAVVGSPTLEPGWLESTAPAFSPLPPAVAGAAGAPTLIGAPNPTPLRPAPEPPEALPPPTDGGGGTTLLASRVPAGVPAPPASVPVPPP